MVRPRRKSNWKRGLWLAVGSILLLSLLALVEITVLLPRRLELERQARRDAPPKLIPPSQRVPDESGAVPVRKVVTAFRIEDWRLEPPAEPDPLAWKGTPADVYLVGYMAFQEAQKLVERGDLLAAREKYELAAKVFGMIHDRQPDFEPAMVEFRRRKISEALAELATLPEAKPQSNLNPGGGGEAGAHQLGRPPVELGS